jgi:hypothetical protein
MTARLDAGPVAVVAVRGLGGAGKSQLALQYAHQGRASGRYQAAGWIRADSPVTVAEDLSALAPLLGLPADLTGWLPHSGAGHVVITSRNRARTRPGPFPGEIRRLAANRANRIAGLRHAPRQPAVAAVVASRPPIRICFAKVMIAGR